MPLTLILEGVAIFLKLGSFCIASLATCSYGRLVRISDIIIPNDNQGNDKNDHSFALELEIELRHCDSERLEEV